MGKRFNFSNFRVVFGVWLYNAMSSAHVATDKSSLMVLRKCAVYILDNIARDTKDTPS